MSSLAQQPKQFDSWFSWQGLYIDTIRNMRDAKAEENWHKYYVFFEFASQMMAPFLDRALARRLESEYRELQKAIEGITNNKELNRESKKRIILTLRTAFADKHQAYVVAFMDRTPLVSIEIEGLIDFGKFEFEEIAKVIQQRESYSTLLEKAKKGIISEEDLGEINYDEQ